MVTPGGPQRPQRLRGRHPARRPAVVRRQPTRLAGAVSVCLAASALLLAHAAREATDPTVRVLLVAVLVPCLTAAWSVWFSDSFEARLLAGLVTCAVASGSVLGATLGMPGAKGGELSATNVVLVLLAVVTWVLMCLDAGRGERGAPWTKK